MMWHDIRHELISKDVSWYDKNETWSKVSSIDGRNLAIQLISRLFSNGEGVKDAAGKTQQPTNQPFFSGAVSSTWLVKPLELGACVVSRDGCWVTQLKLDTLIHGQVWFFSMRYFYFNKVIMDFLMYVALVGYLNGSFSMVGFHVCSWGGQLPRCCWARLEAKLR